MNVIVHSADGRSLTVALGRGVVIGRDPSCDVVVDDHLVSRRHAQLEVDPQGHVVLRDLGSRNGTFVDGKRVEGPVVLAGNERIGIGDAELTLASEVESGPRPDSKDPMVGTMLGRYRIDAKIDEGAMGTVYLAEHTRLGKKVALKVMAQRLFRNQVARQRFVDESRVVASLDHPNIIPVFDADEVQDELYIAMRYVDGEDLGHLLDREGALDPNRAISIISQVGAALDAAHAHGLVHRDVKPTNILIASARDTAGEGHAFLVDFGITKNLASSGLTGTGQTLGTPNYMAPEQFRGQPVDGRTDMYALGCLLYECLTGRPPYEGESFETVMYGHLMTPPPSVATQRPGLPPALDAVVSKAMAKDAGERYATSAELVAAARGALASAPAAAMTQPGAAPAGPVATMAAGPAATMASPGERTAGPPPPPPGVLGSPTVAEPVPPGAALGTTGGRGPRSRRTVLIAGGAIAVVAVAVVAVLVLSGGGSSPPDTRIVAAPSGTVHDSKATVRFSADAAGSSFECSLDGTGFTSCTSPLALDSLDDGRHSFRVRAVNGDGKPDATPASASWRVDDTTAPQTDISKGPPDTASTDSATFSFSSSEAGATFDCSLDGERRPQPRQVQLDREHPVPGRRRAVRARPRELEHPAELRTGQRDPAQGRRRERHLLGGVGDAVRHPLHDLRRPPELVHRGAGARRHRCEPGFGVPERPLGRHLALRRLGERHPGAPALLPLRRELLARLDVHRVQALRERHREHAGRPVAVQLVGVTEGGGPDQLGSRRIWLPYGCSAREGARAAKGSGL